MSSKIDVPDEYEIYQAAFLVVHGWKYLPHGKPDTDEERKKGIYHGAGWYKHGMSHLEEYCYSYTERRNTECFSLSDAYWAEEQAQADSKTLSEFVDLLNRYTPRSKPITTFMKEHARNEKLQVLFKTAIATKAALEAGKLVDP